MYDLKMNSKYLILIVGWFMTISTYAQQTRPSLSERTGPYGSTRPPEVLTNCDSAQTQVELNLCAHMRFQKADQELNALYKQLMSLLPADQKPLVVQAQRQWLSYRDAHCATYEKLYAGGSMLPMVVSACKEETTLNRVNELKALLSELKLRP